MKICSYTACSLGVEWLVDFQGIPVGVGRWHHKVEGRKFGGKDLCDSLDVGARGKGGSRRLCTTQLEMRLGDLFVRES